MKTIDDPADRIRLMERSLLVFVTGIMSLMPGVGLLLAIFTYRVGFTVWRQSRKQWNPGKKYALAGFYLAVFSVLWQFCLGILAALFLSSL